MIHLIEGSVEVTMPGYVDADGHVIEDVAELVKFLDPPFDRMRTTLDVLPGGDRFHTPSGRIASMPPMFSSRPTTNDGRTL